MNSLTDFGIRLKSDFVGDHKTTCPQCSHTRKNTKDQCLSVTTEADGGAVWKCHHCEWSGAIAGESFRRMSINVHSLERNNRRVAPIRKIPEPASMDIPENIIDWFNSRRISKNTVNDFGIFRDTKSFGSEPEGCIAFPYREDGELVNVKYRTRDKRFRQEGGAKRTLFNIDAIKRHWDQTGRKEVVFVEGEMDVLAMWESGVRYAVTLPDGAPKQAKFDAQDKRFDALANCDWLHEAEKVVVAVDGDEPGQALKLELVHRFGKDVCWTVQWPQAPDGSICKDANDVLKHLGPEALKNIVDASQPHPIDGLYTVKDYRQEVLNIYNGNIQQPVDTGFSTLDQIYKVMPSTFQVVTGIPNHGKSNFIDQLAVNLCRRHGWKFAIFSPEHSSANHIRRLIEKVIELPFDVGPNARMSEQQVQKGMDFLDNNFHFIESKDTVPTISWLLSKAKAACMRHGVRGIIIDPYNEIDASRDGGKREDEHIRDLISQCKSFCRKHDVVMWMVAHPSKMQRQPDGSYPPPSMYDISGSAHWNNMADVGLVVHRDFDSGETRVITRKIREQGLYGSIGEAFFRYSLMKHCYEESLPSPPPARPMAYTAPIRTTGSRYWTDND